MVSRGPNVMSAIIEPYIREMRVALNPRQVMLNICCETLFIVSDIAMKNVDKLVSKILLMCR